MPQSSENCMKFAKSDRKNSSLMLYELDCQNVFGTDCFFYIWLTSSGLLNKSCVAGVMVSVLTSTWLKCGRSPVWSNQ